MVRQNKNNQDVLQKNQTLTEKKILYILFFCLIGWIFSIINVQIYELHPSGLGPFQFLPVFYWLILFIAILCTIYLIQIKSKISLKIIATIILGLITIGTIPVIEPYGRGYPDMYCNVDISSLIFQYGTKDYGPEYVRAYPSFFLFTGTLKEILGISIYYFTRFFPLFLVFCYLSGIVVLTNSIHDFYQFGDKNSRFSIISLSFLSLTVFFFSLGIRTDPSPQTFALILLPFFLASFIMYKLKHIIVYIIFLLSIVTTHMVTSFIAILLVFWFLLTADKNKFHRISLPLIMWAGWLIYVGIIQFEFGITYIKTIWRIEVEAGKIAGGMTMPGSELYVHFRLISLILISFLLIISLLYLTKKTKKLTILLTGFAAISSVYLIFYFTGGLQFSTRVTELSSIYISLIFGFGMFLILRDFPEPQKLVRNKIFIYTVVITIIIASFFSVITAKRADVCTGTTQSEIIGFEFLLSHSYENILYPTLPPIVYDSNNYTIWSRIVRAWDEETREGVYRVLDSFNGLIPISQQWKVRQQILEKKELTSLNIAETRLNIEYKFKRIYDNGDFIVYTTLK